MINRGHRLSRNGKLFSALMALLQAFAAKVITLFDRFLAIQRADLELPSNSYINNILRFDAMGIIVGRKAYNISFGSSLAKCQFRKYLQLKKCLIYLPFCNVDITLFRNNFVTIWRVFAFLIVSIFVS